jgi:putative ABC transport system substrate-binding protein
MAYGAPIRDNYLQAAGFVSHILRGVKPAELAIAEPATFDFVINLKSAAALGLALPQTLLARAEKI